MTPDPNPVIAFLNELGRAMRDEQALAIVAYERREALRRRHCAHEWSGVRGPDRGPGTEWHQCVFCGTQEDIHQEAS